MASTTSNVAFGNAYSSVQANTINGSVHIGLENTLSGLPRAEDAPFNSYTKQHEPVCLPDTRVDLLHEIHSWANGTDERCIFWLSGLAGTGKSTIARTVARRYFGEKRLAASFFFSRGGGDVGHAGKFVTSIAAQLARSVPALRQHICNAMTEWSDIVSHSLHDQWQHLVLCPLSKLDEPEPAKYVVVVDALDECDSDSNIRIIVQLLAEARSLTGVQLRVFLTSRPEVPIRHGFGQMADAEHKDVVLHDISPSIVDHDVGLFLEHHLRVIAKECYQAADWPGAEVIRLLVQSASGLFIWAATACHFVREGLFADERLRILLAGSASSDAVAPEEQLNKMYATVLQTSIRPGYNAQEMTMYYSMLRLILGSIVALISPLSVGSLSALLLVPKHKVDQTLQNLHAILNIPGDARRPLRLHHPSFRDFLFDRKRCGEDNFWVDEKGIHKTLASRCLELMSAPNGLRQDMCSLSGPGTLKSEIDAGSISINLSPELQYSCRYWVEHLERSQHSIADADEVHDFLQTHLLHWLEAMSLMEETSQCVRLLTRLQTLVGLSASACASFLRDANRFVLRFCSIVAEAPLQVYSSALVFAPETSIVRKTFVYQAILAVEILSGGEADWDACRSVLEGHSLSVKAVVFSPDGQLVASASRNRTVRVWETATGTCRSELKGHSSLFTAVAFSPDGQLVASASRDRTVRVWETATGTCRSELDNPFMYIDKLTFSPDGTALHTNRRDIPLPADLYLKSPLEPEEHASHLSVKGRWVLRNTQRFLWVPFEFRSYKSAVCKDMVCLGCPSGRVALLRLQ
ncbi:hypothetical protein BU25DRAFT_407050 [Macroventuria anomochaeta]|uniref:Uncharacterized protein n=1 Tax=Macroventuria anomochaeta TaxID=301207 RepID=A0ACB6SDK8_9PLEO|nr:uncharacterized protein BU25DRAFT_407050 [Macroventuria anomochaeta]KAF2631394.1 hypothetical protein BU25DRAFT_407050 [Macroventuria anomochaeta]